MKASRKAPPYSRELKSRLSTDLSRYWGTSSDGRHPAICLLAGSDAWTVANTWREHRLLTLLPPGDEPTKYDWRILSNADPLLLWRCGNIEGNDLLALLQAVMSAGVDRVLDVSTMTRYVREVRRAAA